jgi:hypothetical protein
MDRSAVLAKTAKGVHEVTARAHGLPQKLRSLLIMVDGNATAGDLIAKFSGIAGVEASLAALVEQGFVEIRGEKAGPPSAAAGGAASPSASAAPGPAAPQGAAVPAATRAEALAALTRLLHDGLGPDADPLAVRLERARSRAEFLAAAERCTDTLAALTDSVRARQFRDRAQAYLEQFLRGA